jgi:NAD(P)-dependent dehydrogenase (short-subunit alcohol dehydrogenase family)
MTRTAIITGGASGIGAGLARALAGGGDTVILADQDAAGAQQVAAEIGPLAIAAPVDVRDFRAVSALVDATVSEHGRLDLMFNNAGMGVGGSSVELLPEHWDRIIDVNIKGVANGVQAALPHMLRQGDGHIINTASLAGLVPSPLLAAYAATKHAVVGMTVSMRVEFADRGVRFSVLCPGFTETPILDKENPADLPPIEAAATARQIAATLPGGVYPLDRLVADVLAGVAANAPLVVAPESAAAAWGAWRRSPEGYLDLVTKQAAAALASGH